ncbi:hypothetical protein M8C21_004010, partial [Ambrosia artemisiifolia]
FICFRYVSRAVPSPVFRPSLPLSSSSLPASSTSPLLSSTVSSIRGAVPSPIVPCITDRSVHHRRRHHRACPFPLQRRRHGRMVNLEALPKKLVVVVNYKSEKNTFVSEEISTDIA